MDELEIDGKKYLSSRKAAKEHKYHTDYIGQLIRAGKVVGKKVGRAWYVEEGSLNAYLKSENEGSAVTLEPAVPVIKAIVEEEIYEEVKPEEVAEEETVEEKIEAPVVEFVEPVSKPAEERPEQKVHITLAERAVPERRNTLTYIEDDEPLLPELSGRVRANADFVPLRRAEPEVEPTEELASEEEPIEVKNIRNPRRLIHTSVLATIAVAVFVLFAGLSTLLATSIKVEDGEPASVALTIK